MYEKVRNYEGRVVSAAIMIVYGVTLEGKREVLAMELFVNTVMRFGKTSLIDSRQEDYKK